jgi:serine/threonine protein kinase
VDLYEYITEKGPLDEIIVRRIICILLDVLKTIHTAGVIHRDLKPDNIMIKLKNNKIIDLKLIDFGFAIFHENIS